ncbi:MAG: hypothetical protein RLZZ602_1811 [Pseudomonadota bacterium]
MKMTLKQTKARSSHIERFIIESVDLSLYIAHAVIDGEEHLLAENDGKILKRKNILEMKRCLKAIIEVELTLRQRSAYDEMVGHSYAASANTMELPLGNQPLPEWLQ